MNEITLIKMREDRLKILEEFDKLGKDVGFWYSIDKTTLLGAHKFGGFDPYNTKLYVMMTLLGYEKLKKALPARVIDNINTGGYYDNYCYFTGERKPNQEFESFIEIRLVSSANDKSWKNYASAMNYFRLLFSKDSYKSAKKDLFAFRPTKTVFINKYRFQRQKEAVLDRKLSFETQRIKFGGISVKRVIEWEYLLNRWYGEDFIKNNEKPKKYKVYLRRDKFIEYRN